MADTQPDRRAGYVVACHYTLDEWWLVHPATGKVIKAGGFRCRCCGRMTIEGTVPGGCGACRD